VPGTAFTRSTSFPRNLSCRGGQGGGIDSVGTFPLGTGAGVGYEVVEFGLKSNTHIIVPDVTYQSV